MALDGLFRDLIQFVVPKDDNIMDILGEKILVSGSSPNIVVHDGSKIFFNSRNGKYVKVYCVDTRD